MEITALATGRGRLTRVDNDDEEGQVRKNDGHDFFIVACVRASTEVQCAKFLDF